MPIAVVAKRIAIIAFVCHDETATLEGSAYGTRQVDVLHGRDEMPRIRVLSRRQREGQRPTIPVTDHVDLGRQPAPTAAQGMVYGFLVPPFLPPPEAARVARIDVESIIHVSKSIRPSSRSRS